MGSEVDNNNKEENILPGSGADDGADDDGKAASEEEDESKSTVTTTTTHKDTSSSSEASSDDLDLCLTLLISISTAPDFPDHPRTKPLPTLSSAATSPTSNQVVGWPPVRTNRMNNLNARRNNAKNIILEEVKAKTDKEKIKKPFFVIVNMDGTAIGRKVDLNAHTSYESLGATLNQMFTDRLDPGDNNNGLRLLDGSSEYILTYEDREGDWMLVGDVPWGYFVSTVRKLRIMRTDEMVGLVYSLALQLRVLKGRTETTLTPCIFSKKIPEPPPEVK